jgi:hypothetical protein
MTLSNVNIDDILECDIRGDRFFGKVTEKEKGQVMVEPIGVRQKFPRLVKANQVITRFKRMKG